VGGVLVVSDNALLWVNHSANFGLGLNGDARTTATSLRAAPPGTCVSLRGASAALLGRSPLRVLLSLAGGELLQLSLGADGRGVQAMELVRLASSVPAATLAVLPSSLAPHASFLFLGSRVADSLLLQLGSGGVLTLTLTTTLTLTPTLTLTLTLTLALALTRSMRLPPRP